LLDQARKAFGTEFGSKCFLKIDPALRSVLVVLFSAYSGFFGFFKQKKQKFSFPDVEGVQRQ